MRTALIVAAGLLAVPLVAAAEPAVRAPALSIEGGYAVIDLDVINGAPDSGPYLSATLAWDRAAPAYPVSRGYVWQGDLVPEVSLVRLGERGAILGGLRLELDYAQKEMGLLRVSARGSMWIAPRFGVVNDASGPAIGVDLGTTYLIGRSGWNVGYWTSVLGWREPSPPGGILFPPGTTARDPIALPGDGKPVTVLAFGLVLGRAY